jgi:hypothetical protein
MTPAEAKLILGAHTLSPQADTAELREARAMAEQDQELGAWFQGQCEFDEAVGAAFEVTPIPAGLRERLLQGYEAPIPAPKSGGKNAMMMVWLALAAVVVIAATGVLYTNLYGSHGITWHNEALVAMARIETDPPHMLDLLTHDMGAVKALLTKSGSPMPEGLPNSLTAGKMVGCKAVKIGGHEASIVCFEIEPGVVAHVAVVSVGDVGALPKDHPDFGKNGEWATAQWAGDGKVYFMATRGSSDSLKKIFA